MIKKWRFLEILFCAVYIFTACGENRQTKPTPTPIPQIVTSDKIVFTVERGPLIYQREVNGEIVPAIQDELFFHTSGYVSRVLVKIGDSIKKGDVLAELQMDDILDQLQQARIDLEVSQDNLANEQLQQSYNIQKAKSDVTICQKQLDFAKQNLDNATYTQKLEAQLNVDIAQEKLNTAQAYLLLIKGEVNSDIEKVVQRNQVTVDRLERMVAERQLIAPYDGIVLYINLFPGRQVEAYATLALVGDPTKLVVQVSYDYELVNTVDTSTEVYLYLTKSKEESYRI